MYGRFAIASTLYLVITSALGAAGKFPVSAETGNAEGLSAVEIQIVRPQAKDLVPAGQPMLVEGRIRVLKGAAPPDLLTVFIMGDIISKGKVTGKKISHGMSTMKLGENSDTSRYVKHSDEEFQFFIKLTSPRLAGKYEVHVEGIHVDLDAAKSPNDEKVLRYRSLQQKIEVK